MKNKLLNLLGLPAPTPLIRSNDPWQNESDFNSDAIVDLRFVSDRDSLKDAKTCVQKKLMELPNCGNLLLIGQLSSDSEPNKSIYQHALVGFVKSLAKEIGHNGQTVNLLQVPSNLDYAKIPLALSYFTTNRSAFITGQVVRVTSEGNSGNLRKLTCIVTGGAGGIGLTTAKRLSADGATVLIVDLPNSKDKLTSDLTDSMSFFGADLTDSSDLHKLTEHVRLNFGKVDVLINNAGITLDRTLKKMTDEYWDQVIDVNLESSLSLSKTLLDNDLIANGGTIINTSSISGIAGNFGQTNYTATKAGMIEMARVYSKALATKEITINAIAPGYIETDMVKTMPAMTRFMAERLTCLLQAGKPMDIAEGMAFLAHPGSRSINGQVLRICGGSFLGA